MRLKAKHPCDGCPARNIRSLVGDMISPLTARQVSQRLPMLRMRVSMSCSGIAAHSSCSANRSSRIITGGKVRAAKRLPRKPHRCSMGLRSGDRAGQSIRSISSLSKSCSAATVR
ncbi:hypothetical protein TNCV_4880701 [Trichonephila clavipes]|nr:hypothetical protein TNCV_4880701 [Trichonephila clavipes]